MNKLILLFIALNFLVLSGINAQVEEPIDSSKLTIARIFNSGEFRQDRFGRYKWLGNGDYYTLLEKSDSIEGGRDIVKYNTKSGKSEILINAKCLIPEGKEKPLRIYNYSWSDDQSKLMIFTNTKRVWRSHTRGDYWVFDVSAEKLFQLGAELPESSLMFAKFTTNGKKAAFVSKHNIYVQ
ncbi:MAG: DPP IV N-terminal domain-containing protein, partial [Bacteroidales bacterium]|nr:DPP IV N-terminal domain-containing protein [Bacteroidales bacterium]